MKVSARYCALLWLALSCSLAGCGSKPQPHADSGSAGTNAGGAAGQTNARAGTAGGAATDEAARMFAEVIKEHAASAGSQRSPAEALLATPTPSWSDRFDPKGKSFVSLGGRFSVTLPPGFPPFKNEMRTIRDNENNQDLDLPLYRSDTPGRTCQVAYFDITPTTLLERKSKQQELEGVRDTTLQRFDGKLEKQENLTLQGNPAISFYSSMTLDGKPTYFRGLYVVATTHLYLVGYRTDDRGGLDAPDVAAYFTSFHLLD